MTTPVNGAAAAATASPVGNVQQEVTELIQQATKSDDIKVRRELLSNAFQKLREKGSETVVFYELLHAYAKGTCYAQKGPDGDPQTGFRKCARLMELSFMLQLTAMGLAETKCDWKSYDSLEKLIESLGEKGLFEAVTTNNTDPDVLLKRAQEKGMQEVLADTLVRLCFSYQNTGVRDYSLQKRFSDLTVKIIGNETEKQKAAVVDFLYNRCRFHVALQGGGLQQQVESYEPIKQKILELWPERTFKRESLLAQMDNMKGRLNCDDDTDEPFPEAEPFFQAAFDRRLPLVDEPGITDAEKWDQRFLLCNIRTGLIACLSKHDPLTEPDVQKLNEHAKALEECLRDALLKGNGHCYIAEYGRSILRAATATRK